MAAGKFFGKCFLVEVGSGVLGLRKATAMAMAAAVKKGSSKLATNWQGFLLPPAIPVLFQQQKQQQVLMNKEAAGHHQNCCNSHDIRASRTGKEEPSACWSFRFRTMEHLGMCPVLQQPSHGFCSSRLVSEDSTEETEDSESESESESTADTESESEESESESESESTGSSSKQWPSGKQYPSSVRIREIRECDYDDIMEREKKLKLAWRIKDVLLKQQQQQQPQWSMTLRELGRTRDDIGFPRKKELLSFLKRLPAIFEVEEEEEDDARTLLLLSSSSSTSSSRVHLTPEAEALCQEECWIRQQMEKRRELAEKLRKLLMMSSSRRLALRKLAHLAEALGLPADFRKALVHQYPQYFRVVESADVISLQEGPVLELVEWSDELAVTAADKKLREHTCQSSSGAVPRLAIRLPRQYRLSNKDKWVMYKFHELQAPTPYEDSSKLHPASAEAEKRAVLTVQEVLSLVLEKRILVDHLTHFRKEFKFSNQIRGMLLRHPEYFYVSRKGAGARETVFLRDAFEGIRDVPGQRQECVLRDKHPLVVLKEKFAALMQVRQRRIAPATNTQTHHVFGS